MSYLKHPEVVSSVYSKFEKAKSSGALFFYPSTRSRATEHNINFEITTCPALQKKPALPAPDFSKRDKPDPFAPPYVPDLFIGELKDELEGDEYVILVRFHPQNSPLTPPELTQAYLLIRASQKAKSPIFAFYNCGAEEDDEDEDDSRPPVESYVQNLKIEDDTKVFSLPLPYVTWCKGSIFPRRRSPAPNRSLSKLSRN
ncbi:ATP adenylyltransferase [Rhizoctonia solani]|uniref:ATP adenylyltransferase n=1 Tax=Rhizoctonia solani TaxID=456999 RepID=A0A8H7I293_9AGAM|nr:ATP adenylyltransferase [Rhizoctonia solani]